MRPAVQSFRVLIVVAPLVLVACGNSKSTNTPNAPATNTAPAASTSQLAAT